LVVWHNDKENIRKMVKINKKQVFIITLGVATLLFASFTMSVIVQKQQNSLISGKSTLNESQNPVQNGHSDIFEVSSNAPSDSYMNANNGILMIDVPQDESFYNNNEILINGTGGVRGTSANGTTGITAVSAITGTGKMTAADAGRGTATAWIPIREVSGTTAGGVAVLSGIPGTTPINWTITLGTRMSGVSGMTATDATRTTAGVMHGASDMTTQPDSMGFIDSGTFYMDFYDDMDEEENNISNIINVVQRFVAMKPFTIGKYEVTQKEYRELMGTNPSYFIGDNLPVENVSWFDAIEYCNALSRREGLPVAYKITGTRDDRVVTWDRNSIGYRLPTEAEWEYSCRAGTRTLFNTGDSINRNQANFFHNTTIEVGSYPPNEWGLHDMHGNVSEWCWDLYNDPAMGNSDNSLDERRVIRGGSWISYDLRLRSASRDWYFPNYCSVNIGFRVARNVPNTSSFFR